ncbi:MAG: PKD domain-containing protein, partial [Flavobacteriales bacterium]|nr:PKD domain-containing protein [Flavobacteriales bacterium]
TADGSSFSTLIDSIRLKHNGIVYDTVDGWGTTIIPTGSYNSLRIKRVEDAIDSIWTKAPDLGFPFPPPDWVFFDAITDTNTTYTWLAKEGKLAIAELNFDSLDNPNVLTWTLIPAIPVANFSHTDNGSGGYTFTDQSSNTPTTWLWDFGDGNTSAAQNPAYQYAADGTYTVCLTIFNASGADTVCSTVVVTGVTGNPPPIANFIFTQNGTGLLDFTDQSSNPPFLSWGWDFGDLTTSTAQNPTHQYASNGTYTICLTVTNANGNDQTCQTAIITGIGGGPVAPVALFSWQDGGGALINFTDQTSNTPISWAWDFGDGVMSTVQSPVHQYAATATKYNACLTATNSAGSDTYCDSVISPDSIITPGIEKMDLGSSVHVYPNPALDYVQIEMEDGGGGQFVFSLYNALGQRVLLEAAGISVGQIWNIGLEQMPQGSYFYLLLNQETGAQSSGKLEIR